MIRKIARRFLISLIFLVAIGLMSYPFVANAFYQSKANSYIEVYKEKEKDMSSTEREEILRKARVYNEGILNGNNVIIDPFKGDVKEKVAYEDILNTTKDGVMGVIEIPQIDVRLPIYHGTSADVLERGIGHVRESSLPVGGKGTHAVLTGHTGLNNAKMFTDIDRLKKKDKFFIKILGKTLAYKVDKISVVLPEELDEITIEKEKDYCTLLTCTPYGINDHRLLVRGKRIPYRPEDENANLKKRTGSRWMEEYRYALYISIALAGGYFALWSYGKYVKTKNAPRGGKH